MKKEELAAELKNFLDNYLREQGFVLVELVYRYEGKNTVLKILVDRPEGGISIEDCAYLNEQLGSLLDEKDLIHDNYLLEVSSPGLDRPLRTRDDFLRCLNRKVRIFLRESVDGKMELEGVIIKVEDDSVDIDIDGNHLQVSLSKITKAKQEVVSK